MQLFFVIDLFLDYNGNLSLKELLHILFLFTGEHLCFGNWKILELYRSAVGKK